MKSIKNVLFTGACTALVTPFINGKVNYPLLEQLLKRQVDAGIEAVVIAGTTGEAPTLSDEEKITMIRRAKEYVGDSCQIIAGTGSNSTEHAVKLSIAAEEAGADGLLVVSPYYNKASTAGLVAHYIAIARSVSIPMVLYNVPSRTGVDIPVHVYKQLSRIQNIVAVKEASGDIRKIVQIRRECGDDLTIYSGNDDMTVPMMSLGAKGVISVMSNVCPVEMQTMAKAALSGDFDTAEALQCSLQPLSELLFCEVNPIPVKTAMNLIGFDCGECRLPLTPLSDENKERMNSYFHCS